MSNLVDTRRNSITLSNLMYPSILLPACLMQVRNNSAHSKPFPRPVRLCSGLNGLLACVTEALSQVAGPSSRADYPPGADCEEGNQKDSEDLEATRKADLKGVQLPPLSPGISHINCGQRYDRPPPPSGQMVTSSSVGCQLPAPPQSASTWLCGPIRDLTVCCHCL